MKTLLLLLISSFAFGAGIGDPTGITAYIQAPNKSTYSSAATISPSSGRRGDICTIWGNASKDVVVYKVRVSSTQTTAGINTWYLNKHAIPYSGGTSTDQTIVPLDSGFMASGGTSVKTWSADPTGGSSVGSIRIANVGSPATTTAIQYAPYEFDFSPETGGRPVVLHGATEGLGISLNGAAVPAGLATTCDFMWSENNL